MLLVFEGLDSIELSVFCVDRCCSFEQCLVDLCPMGVSGMCTVLCLLVFIQGLVSTDLLTAQ